VEGQLQQPVVTLRLHPAPLLQEAHRVAARLVELLEQTPEILGATAAVGAEEAAAALLQMVVQAATETIGAALAQEVVVVVLVVVLPMQQMGETVAYTVVVAEVAA
jgi:hypothetical protein